MATRAGRFLPVLMALLFAPAVAAAMVAIGAHNFTDAVGEPQSAPRLLACALTLDLVASRQPREPAVPPLPGG